MNLENSIDDSDGDEITARGQVERERRLCFNYECWRPIIDYGVFTSFLCGHSPKEEKFQAAYLRGMIAYLQSKEPEYSREYLARLIRDADCFHFERAIYAGDRLHQPALDIMNN